MRGTSTLGHHIVLPRSAHQGRISAVQSLTRNTRHCKRQEYGMRVHASAAAAPAPADDGKQHGVLSVFRVFSDKTCNQKFLALTVGQTLSSVATLIHDSYLPVYVQDVLGLSNTKVGITRHLVLNIAS
jgi:hypothetical protein